MVGALEGTPGCLPYAEAGILRIDPSSDKVTESLLLLACLPVADRVCGKSDDVIRERSAVDAPWHDVLRRVGTWAAA